MPPALEQMSQSSTSASQIEREDAEADAAGASEMDGEVDAGGCLWLGFRSWSMHRAHDVTEGVETRSGGPFLTAVLHTAADR